MGRRTGSRAARLVAAWQLIAGRSWAMPSRRAACCFGLLTLWSTVLAGCGGGGLETHPVRGKVAFADGTPLTRGTVELESLDSKPPVSATGEIDSDGTFELGTLEPGDGAVAGRHRAVVVVHTDVDTGREDVAGPPRDVIHPRFRSFGTSGLEFTVKKGPNELNITVEEP